MPPLVAATGSFVDGFLEAWGIAAALMAALWVAQRFTRDAGIVDVGWAAGLGLLAAFHALRAADAPLGRRLLVAGLAGTWALRLSVHLLRDRVIGRPARRGSPGGPVGAAPRESEDGRYATLRASWGRRAQPFFFLFFQAQALLDAILAVPFQVALATPRAPGDAIDVASVSLLAVSVGGETLADRTLARFRARADSKGRTCREGLWRYSRHPNYFFEWLHWWTYPLLAWGAPWWALTLSAPALMLFFLLRVTGIPATEAQAVKSRGEDYREYQRTTSAFVPWPPRAKRGQA
jgi:steroid 5-alpha reductase family enzyme